MLAWTGRADIQMNMNSKHSQWGRLSSHQTHTEYAIHENKHTLTTNTHARTCTLTFTHTHTHTWTKHSHTHTYTHNNSQRGQLFFSLPHGLWDDYFFHSHMDTSVPHAAWGCVCWWAIYARMFLYDFSGSSCCLGLHPHKHKNVFNTRMLFLSR